MARLSGVSGSIITRERSAPFDLSKRLITLPRRAHNGVLDRPIRAIGLSRMDSNTPKAEGKPLLSKLYPELDPEQLKEAAENLDHYVALVLRISERVRQGRTVHAESATLTGTKDGAAMEAERSTTQTI